MAAAIEHVIFLLSFLRRFSLFVHWSKSCCPLECGEAENPNTSLLNKTPSVFTALRRSLPLQGFP